MFDRLVSRISYMLGVTALKQEIRILQDGINSLQKSHAAQELRAATWHVESLNQQRKLEASISEFELISTQLRTPLSREPISAGADTFSASALEELKREVQKLREALDGRENGISQ
jgi:hypothetical protein